ncbi:hypothetical protein IGI04_023969 [Brassica rapa subsp. trilocularis]|uniref:Inositol hexakisphosphate and diphosphoinositol-pentakisphosphate kinase n=1 Tax=Brassica rapa subsp. trilocularis TaxID=1813537 RepID=A0ABQ7M5E7_BRACM|nr:hypothetical protein IGI04_023969 [Brassica rapa subsp. trilocularis]
MRNKSTVYIRDTQGLKIQTFSFHSLNYYSQISPLILLRYYDDVACVLRKMCLDAKAPHLSSTLPPTLPWKFNKHVQPNKGLTRQGNGNSEELRCVIAVIRHGDRITKQKVKLNVSFGAKKYVYPWIQTQVGWSNGKVFYH